MALTYEEGVKIGQASSFSIRENIEAMDIEGLVKVKEFLNSKTGKTTNMVKVRGIFELFPAYATMGAIQVKISATMAHYKELFNNDLDNFWVDDSGKPMIEELKDLITATIAVKQSQGMQQ